MPVATPTLAIADLGTGTTGTATITGSTALTTNTLYYQSVSNRGGAWVSAGSRTADGTISITGMTAGYYWWKVDSTDGSTSAISNLVYQPILSDDDAFYSRCKAACVARLQELTLANIPTSRIYAQSFNDTTPDVVQKPCIIVSLESPTTENILPGGPVSTEDYGYPVFIIILMDGPHLAEDADVWEKELLKCREQCVRALVSRQLDGISENYNCLIEFNAIVGPEGKSQDVIYSAFVARFVNRLSRGLT